MFVVILLANFLLLSFTFVDERISTLVNRWLFRPPDYRGRHPPARQPVGPTAARIRNRRSRGRCRVARPALARRAPDRCRKPAAVPWSAAILEGELVELGYTDPLRATAAAGQRRSADPDHLRRTGHACTAGLARPRPPRPGHPTISTICAPSPPNSATASTPCIASARPSSARAARPLLLQQVTEAELRALRAQINPHFLFNSLNTIADLIVRDPPRAEAMTLRLASVFRHVLAHSSRPLTTIREEMEFLRTYLYIEEARFGDRLHVEIDVAPEAAGQQIPSLILQPLVENAMKHGLGPKPGPGNMWISARIERRSDSA